MIDEDLARHAAAAGIETEWRDIAGIVRQISPTALRGILDALGPLPDLSHPPMITGDLGQSRSFAASPAPTA